MIQRVGAYHASHPEFGNYVVQVWKGSRVTKWALFERNSDYLSMVMRGSSLSKPDSDRDIKHIVRFALSYYLSSINFDSELSYYYATRGSFLRIDPVITNVQKKEKFFIINYAAKSDTATSAVKEYYINEKREYERHHLENALILSAKKMEAFGLSKEEICKLVMAA